MGHQQRSLICLLDRSGFFAWCVPYGTWCALRAWCRLRLWCTPSAREQNASHHLSQRSCITYHLFAKQINLWYNLIKQTWIWRRADYTPFRFLTPIFSPLYCSYACKKTDLSTRQIRLLCVMRSLRNVMHTACVMQASPAMHAFGACVERIASPITAKLHHLSLVCKTN